MFVHVFVLKRDSEVGIILTYLKIIQQPILSMVICFLLAAYLLSASTFPNERPERKNRSTHTRSHLQQIRYD